jgi:hypothetical protein
MKKRSFKPGYEFIFTLCVLAILGLPPLVFAQSTKDMDITIVNGDTTVNGKNIKDLRGKERTEALNEIGKIGSIKNNTPMMAQGNMKHKMQTGHAHADSNRMHIETQRRMDIRVDRADEDHRGMVDHKNTQNFIYSSTDNNGMTTRVSFHITDHFGPLDADVIKDENQQLDMLDLQDLSIVPEFSAGKILLLFNLPSKTVAEVKLKDSKGTILWSEKAVNGKFSTTFSLGLNGIYYLQVRQGGKITVKKIIKE